MRWRVASESHRWLESNSIPRAPAVHVPMPPYHAYEEGHRRTACGIELNALWSDWEDASWPMAMVVSTGDNCVRCREVTGKV
jgi:hypothetical protein